MDNVIGDGNIADLFAEKYSDLYNSVSYNKDDMYHRMSKVEKLISDKGGNTKRRTGILTVDDIVEGVSHVKSIRKMGMVLSTRITLSTVLTIVL